MDMLLNGGVDRTSLTTVLTADSVEEMLRRQTTDELVIANTPTGNNRYGIGVWLDQLGQAGPVVDVLAAGARGFHSWIDKSAGLVSGVHVCDRSDLVQQRRSTVVDDAQ
jgi:hypothetical protein